MYIHIHYKEGLWIAETMEYIFRSENLDALVDFLITKIKCETNRK